jgi:transglutaminase-like putative cysteine protease
MYKKWIFIFFCLLLPFSAMGNAETSIEKITRLVSSGQWQQASAEIETALQKADSDFRSREQLLFQKERMARMKLDFNKTREQVLAGMQKIVPEVTDALFDKWEKQNAIEYLEIDGQKKYFYGAAANVFRINPEAKAMKEKHKPSVDTIFLAVKDNIAEIIGNFEKSKEKTNVPKTFRIAFQLTVNPNAVPDGEIIRAWLPFPKENDRQKNIWLVTADPAQYLIADNSRPQRTVYLEKTAEADKPTQFKIVFEYTVSGSYQPLDPAQVKPINPQNRELIHFLGEQPPHIIFSEEIRSLSRQIIGQEQNPLKKAKLIFQWVSENIPWAAAREYSTIESLCLYPLENRHGDCGLQTMLFMTLCRFNGIPARWESGMVTGSHKNIHDWCRIYLEPYGWIPMDPSFGIMNSPDGRVKFFFFGNIDSFRLVVNSDYGKPFYPAKLFFRSEPSDFQRGEVEWAGGNLYYDQWDWEFSVEELKK